MQILDYTKDRALHSKDVVFLKSLVNHNSRNVLICLAENKSITPEIIDLLITKQDHIILDKLAGNTSTPVETLKKLYNGADAYRMRVYLLKNKSVSEHIKNNITLCLAVRAVLRFV